MTGQLAYGTMVKQSKVQILVNAMEVFEQIFSFLTLPVMWHMSLLYYLIIHECLILLVIVKNNNNNNNNNNTQARYYSNNFIIFLKPVHDTTIPLQKK